VAAGNGLTPGNGVASGAGPVAVPVPPVTDRTQLVADHDEDRTELVPDMAEGRTQVFGAASAGGTGGPGTAPGTMPPLRRPEDDDREDRYTGGRHASAQPSRNRWAWLVAGLVLLALVGGGTWFLLAGGDDPGAGTPGATTTSAPPATTSAGTFTIDPALFVGRPADEAQAELEALGLGLVVQQEPADAARLAAAGLALDRGDVAALDPSGGTVGQGDTVTLFYAPQDYTPDSGEEEPSQAPETSEAPRTTAEPTEEEQTSQAPAPTTRRTTTPAPTQQTQPDEDEEEQPTETEQPTSTAPGSPAPPPAEDTDADELPGAPAGGEGGTVLGADAPDETA
jgi:serine/threonine-protein kinase